MLASANARMQPIGGTEVLAAREVLARDEDLGVKEQFLIIWHSPIRGVHSRHHPFGTASLIQPGEAKDHP